MEKQNNKNFIEKLNKVNKLNKLTILLIIVLYIIVVAVVGTLMHKAPEYKVYESAEESFGEIVNFSTFIMNKITATVDEHDGEKHIEATSKYYIYTLSDAYGEGNYANVKYDLTVETTEGNYVYFDRMNVGVPYSNSKRNVISIKSDTSSTLRSTYSDANALLTAEGVSKIFGKVKYNYTENSQTKTENYTFIRNILTLSDKEKNSANSENTLSDLLNIELYIVTNESSYASYAFNVKELDIKTVYKLDMQAFIENSEGEVLPLCGIYNYADDDTQFTTTSKFTNTPSSNQIPHTFDAQKIYLKVRVHINADNYKETVIAYNYDELLDKARD